MLQCLYLTKVLYFLLFFCNISATIDGQTYYDRLNTHEKDQRRKEEDPCNPLYWYPRAIPDYCNRQNISQSPRSPSPILLPPPPPPLPIPIPSYNYPIPLPAPMMPQPMPLPMPLPYGIPIIPTPVLPMPSGIPLPPPPDPCANYSLPPPCPAPSGVNPPVPITNPLPPSVPAPLPPPMPPPAIPAPLPAPMSMPMPAPFPMPGPMLGPMFGPMPGPMPNPYPISVPFSGPFQSLPSGYVFQPPHLMPPRIQGLPGVINKDGGINILPFSDVYTDILEKHKQKIIRKKLKIFLKDMEKEESRMRRRKPYKRGYIY